MAQRAGLERERERPKAHKYPQFILRVPDEIKEQVQRFVEDPEDKTHISIVPRDETATRLSMDVDFYIAERRFPAVLVNLPCVVETHKTFDHVTYFKGGDVGQMIIVCMTKEQREEIKQTELEKLPGTDYYSSGLTIPTHNIVRRRFAKTRKNQPFEPEEVRRVEEELSRYKMDEEVIEVFEEVVDFEEYMVSEQEPNGITVDLYSDLVRRHPEIAEIKDEPPPTEAELRDEERRLLQEQRRSEIAPAKKAAGQGGPGRPPNRPGSKPTKKKKVSIASPATLAQPAPAAARAPAPAAAAAPAVAASAGQSSASSASASQPPAASAPAAAPRPVRSKEELQNLLHMKERELQSCQEHLQKTRESLSTANLAPIKARLEDEQRRLSQNETDIRREIAELKASLQQS